MMGGVLQQSYIALVVIAEERQIMGGKSYNSPT